MLGSFSLSLHLEKDNYTDYYIDEGIPISYHHYPHADAGDNSSKEVDIEGRIS